MKTSLKILFILLFTHFSTILIQAQKQKNQQVISYDFSRRQFEENDKKYLRQHKNIVLKVSNINTLLYDIEAERNEILFTLSNTRPNLNPAAAATLDTAGLSRLSNEIEKLKEKEDKKKMESGKDISGFLGLIFSEVKRLQNAYKNFISDYNVLIAYPSDPSFCSKTSGFKITYKSLEDNHKTYKNSEGSIRKLLKFPSPYEHISDSPSVKTAIVDVEQILSLTDISTLTIKADSIYHILSDCLSCNYYYPEFNTKADELELTIKYKLRNADPAIPYTQIALPTLRFARFLRIGLGTGPVMTYIPNESVYFRKTIPGSSGGSDSLFFYSRNPRNTFSFAFAVFTDLDYQITPVTSLGIGIGSGINMGTEISGNIFTGLNAGFRIASQVQVNLRSGLTFSQRDVLIDKFDQNILYPVTDLNDEPFLQKKWMPGFFCGVTISYVTRSIKTK